MGYTHYWTHSEAFTADEWQAIEHDVCRILRAAQERGVDLSNGMGDTEIDPEGACLGAQIVFNGLGEKAHETICIYKNRRPPDAWQEERLHGWDFCKTAQKPYDVAVTAILAYLESIYPGKFSVSSDGDYFDWLAGIELAKTALPAHADDIRAPVEVMRETLERME